MALPSRHGSRHFHTRACAHTHTDTPIDPLTPPPIHVHMHTSLATPAHNPYQEAEANIGRLTEDAAQMTSVKRDLETRMRNWQGQIEEAWKGERKQAEDLATASKKHRQLEASLAALEAHNSDLAAKNQALESGKSDESQKVAELTEALDGAERKTRDLAAQAEAQAKLEARCQSLQTALVDAQRTEGDHEMAQARVKELEDAQVAAVVEHERRLDEARDALQEKAGRQLEVAETQRRAAEAQVQSLQQEAAQVTQELRLAREQAEVTDAEPLNGLVISVCLIPSKSKLLV